MTQTVDRRALMSRRMILAATTVLVALLPLLPPRSSASTMRGVTVSNNTFQPAMLSVEAGDTVQWQIQDGQHQVAADDGTWATGSMGAGETYARVFASPGTYPYYCTIHGGPGGVGMAGEVRVVEPASTTTTTTQPPTSTTIAPMTTTTVPATIANSGNGMTILSTSMWSEPNSGYRHVVGELRNSGDVNRSFNRVVVDLYDASGRLLNTESGFVQAGVLAPGEKAGFDVMFSPPAGWYRYAVTTSNEPTTRHPNHNFAVTVSNRFTDSAGFEHIVGRITNTNTVAAENAWVYGTLYDGSGRVVGQHETPLAITNLAPGESASYEFYRSAGEPSFLSWSIFAESHTDPSPVPGNSRPYQEPTAAAPSPPAAAVPAGPSGSDGGGYWMVGADGRVDAFGGAGDVGGPAGQLGKAAAVDLEPTPSGEGYWVVDDHGKVFTYGDAVNFGGISRGLSSTEKVTSLSATRSGRGYWLFTSKGRVFTYGDAAHLGDLGAMTLNGPVLDSVVTPSGRGYWMVASDGGIFSFGDAEFFGSMGGERLNKPVVSMAPDGDGDGYWLVASDGGIFAFDAPFYGSMGQTRLNKAVTGIVPGNAGYLMVAEDGGIFAFGNVAFHGSLGATPPTAPIVAAALKP